MRNGKGYNSTREAQITYAEIKSWKGGKGVEDNGCPPWHNRRCFRVKLGERETESNQTGCLRACLSPSVSCTLAFSSSRKGRCQEVRSIATPPRHRTTQQFSYVAGLDDRLLKKEQHTRRKRGDERVDTTTTAGSAKMRRVRIVSFPSAS